MGFYFIFKLPGCGKTWCTSIFPGLFSPSEADLRGAALPLTAVSLLTALWQNCQLALPGSRALLQGLSSQLLEFTLRWKHLYLENLLGGNLAAAGDES